MAETAFRIAARVRVTLYQSDDYARTGVVTRVTEDGTVFVRIDGRGYVRGFLPVALEPIA